ERGGREASPEPAEALALIGDFLLPQGRSDREQAREPIRAHVESAQLEIRRPRQPADGRFGGAGAAGAAIEHPGQHPQVLAVTGPAELALRVAAEPVDVIDARRPREPGADVEPVPPGVAEVVTAERLH